MKRKPERRSPKSWWKIRAKFDPSFRPQYRQRLCLGVMIFSGTRLHVKYMLGYRAQEGLSYAFYRAWNNLARRSTHSREDRDPEELSECLLSDPRTNETRPTHFADRRLAGPGEYTNASEGSPVAALGSATAAIQAAGSAWIAGDVTCAFIEPDHDRCQRLRQRVSTVRTDSKIKTQVLEKTFVDGVAELRRVMPGPFTTAEPLFVFIDPFGATGVPFTTVASLLSTPCSEVLINLDSDGIARNLPSPGLKEVAQREALMTSVFGDDSWRAAITSTNFKIQCQQVLDLYKKKLRSISAVEYVFSFEMRGSGDTLNYHLVFASQNPLGLKKMKEAMKSIDKTGSYSFSDGHINQTTLFRFDHAEDFAPRLYQQFLGQEVPYVDIAKLTLNETPFIEPIQMLKVLLDRGQIEVTRIDPKRNRGLSEDHVSKVKFLNKPPVEKASPIGGKQGDLFSGN